MSFKKGHTIEVTLSHLAHYIFMRFLSQMCFNVCCNGLSQASRGLGSRSSPRSGEVVTKIQHQTATAGFPIKTSHLSVTDDSEVLN